MSFKKNTAVTGFPVHLISSTDGSDITTGTPVGYYLLDGGTQTAIGDVTPVHEGNGQWTFDLTSGEMNGDIIGLVFTHASAITAHFTIKTDTKIVSELNDIAATAIVSGGAINTTGGAVDDVTLVATTTTNTDMVGTDNALLAANINLTAGAIDNVTLVATTTTNTDMVGTDNAALASVCTEGRLAELDGANLPADVDNILTDTGTTIPGTITTLQADTDDIQTRLPAALVSGKMDSDAVAIAGSTDSATRLLKATQCNVYCTVGSSSTTTSIITSSMDPAASVTDQFKGKIVTFDANTTTAALRGQSTDITANTSVGVLTVTALTTAAVSGDIFVIT